MQTFKDYEEFTKSTAIYPGAGTGSKEALSYVALGLAGEAGEVANKIKKYIRDDKFDESVVKEVGDVLWYVARMAQELSISLEEIAQSNAVKLSSRKERGMLQGSGDNR